MPLASGNEKRLDRSVDSMAACIDSMCLIVGNSSPFIAEQLKGISNQLRVNLVEARRHSDYACLIGQGDSATALRRVLKKDDADIRIRQQTPYHYNYDDKKKNEVRAHILSEVRKWFGSMELYNSHTFVRWSTTGPECFGGLRVGVYTLHPFCTDFDELQSGIHGNDYSFQKSTDTAILAVRLKGVSETFVLVTDDGHVSFATYVPLEDHWALHEDSNYVCPDLWDTTFAQLRKDHGYDHPGVDMVSLIETFQKKLSEQKVEPVMISDKLGNRVPSPAEYPGAIARPLTLDYYRTDENSSVTFGRSFDYLMVTKGLNRFTFRWTQDRSDITFDSISTRQAAWESLPHRVQEEIAALAIDAIEVEGAEIATSLSMDKSFES